MFQWDHASNLQRQLKVIYAKIEKFPNEDLKMMPNDLKSVANSLYEWIKFNSKPIMKSAVEKVERPPWVGSMESVRTTASFELKRKPTLDTGLKK